MFGIWAALWTSETDENRCAGNSAIQTVKRSIQHQVPTHATKFTCLQKTFGERDPEVAKGLHLLQLPGHELHLPEVPQRQQRRVRLQTVLSRLDPRLDERDELIADAVELLHAVRCLGALAVGEYCKQIEIALQRSAHKSNFVDFCN